MPIAVTEDDTTVDSPFNLNPIAKAIVAFVLGLIGFVTSLVSTGPWTTQSTIAVVTWLTTTAGVYLIPNKAAK